jgi:hypothetical protein
MTQSRSLLALLCIAIGSGSALIAQSSQPAQADIDTVRATYAKLEFAVRLQAVMRNIIEPSGADSELAPGQSFTVTLSEIKSGPVNEIRSASYPDLVTHMYGRTLQTTPGSYTLNTEAGEHLEAETAQAHWTSSELRSGEWDGTFGQLEDMGALDRSYTRYVAYTATVSYLGEQRQYHAMFLFGQDAAAKPVVLPLDSIVGNTLFQIIPAPVTPDPLQAPPYRGQEIALAFIQSLLAPASCTPEPRTQMCCDEKSGKCGVSAATLRNHHLPATENLNPASLKSN